MLTFLMKTASILSNIAWENIIISFPALEASVEKILGFLWK